MKVQHQTPQVITADRLGAPCWTDCLALKQIGTLACLLSHLRAAHLAEGRAFPCTQALGWQRKGWGLKEKIHDCTVQTFKIFFILLIGQLKCAKVNLSWNIEAFLLDFLSYRSVFPASTWGPVLSELKESFSNEDFLDLRAQILKPDCHGCPCLIQAPLLHSPPPLAHWFSLSHTNMLRSLFSRKMFEACLWLFFL